MLVGASRPTREFDAVDGHSPDSGYVARRCSHDKRRLGRPETNDKIVALKFFQRGADLLFERAIPVSVNDAAFLRDDEHDARSGSRAYTSGSGGRHRFGAGN